MRKNARTHRAKARKERPNDAEVTSADTAAPGAGKQQAASFKDAVQYVHSLNVLPCLLSYIFRLFNAGYERRYYQHKFGVPYELKERERSVQPFLRSEVHNTDCPYFCLRPQDCHSLCARLSLDLQLLLPRGKHKVSRCVRP